MRRKGAYVALLLVLVTLVTGCFGRREVDELAMVMAVGLDLGKEPGTIRITAQIARPGDVRGQTGAPTAGTGDPIWTASAEGRSIFEAIRNLGRFSSRRVFWAHNQVIVINEDLAREGIREIIDFFTRNHELRMRTWVVVTPAKASELVATKTGLEVIPGVSVDKLFRYSPIVSESPRTDLRMLSAAYLSQSTHPVLARLTPKNRQISASQKGEFGTSEQVELSGTAVFNRDKMVGWLDPEQSHGLLWFIEPVESRLLSLPCPDDHGKTATLEMKHHRFDVKPSYVNGKVKFRVELEAKMDLVELGCLPTKDQFVYMKQLQGEAARALRREIERAVKTAQSEYRVDILELGKSFQNRYPAEWHQLRKSWEEVFPEAEVQVTVRADINSPVLLQKGTMSGK